MCMLIHVELVILEGHSSVERNWIKTIAFKSIKVILCYKQNRFIVAALWCTTFLIHFSKAAKAKNTEVSVITRTKPREHIIIISPVLVSLYWLPVARKVYKSACLFYKCIHNCTLTYLSSLIEIQRSVRALISFAAILWFFFIERSSKDFVKTIRNIELPFLCQIQELVSTYF